MARFLSPEWFEDVLAHQEPLAYDDAPDRLVIEQAVEGTPDGDVRYLVVATGGRVVLEPVKPGRDLRPDLTIGCDWLTAVALARGDLASQAALLEGRLRVSGNLARIAGRASGLAGMDPLPPEVRARTTF